LSTQFTHRPRLAFGPFEFDPSSGELRKHRSLIRLQGQPLRILSVLIGHPGELVGRLELQRQLWPGVANGDFEHGLNAAVNKLRQALNDSADQPRYIETIAGQGYRFIAPLQTPNQRPHLELVPSQHNPARQVPNWVYALVGAITILIAGIWAGTRLKPINAALETIQFEVAPPPGYFIEPAGIRQTLALSPDGNFLAYSAMDRNGEYHILLRDFRQLQSELVPESQGARSAFWSPTGNSLYFPSRGKLRRFQPGSNAAVPVNDAIPVLTKGALLPDGRILISSNQQSAYAPANGASLEPIEQIFSWPQMIPGTQLLLYSSHLDRSFRWQARIADSGSPTKSQAVGDFDSHVEYTNSIRGSGGYLMSVSQGTLTAQPFDMANRRNTGQSLALLRHLPFFPNSGAADFSVSASGVLAYLPLLSRTQFFWVDRQGNKLAPASPPGLAAKFASTSPDGRHVAVSIYQEESGQGELWIFDAKTARGRKLDLSRANHHVPLWSPDSQRLVYLKAMYSTPKLAIVSIEAGAKEIALPEAGFMVPTCWSSDGRYILFHNTGVPLSPADGSSDIFLMDTANNNSIRPFIKTPFHETNGVLSPDMSRVAFLSNESGKPELFIQAVESLPYLHPVGNRTVVSVGVAFNLRWRRDGKELFYQSDNGTIFSVLMGSGIGTPKPLFTIAPEATAAIHSIVAFDISPDGQRFLIPIVNGNASPPIVVIRNWESALLPKR